MGASLVVADNNWVGFEAQMAGFRKVTSSDRAGEPHSQGVRVNQNHMAHELGHVLALGNPGNSGDNLVDGCAGSVMEPSGFFADNPGVQCDANCQNDSNPLLRLRPGKYCLSIDRPDQQLL
jgi:hypothetical protein